MDHVVSRPRIEGVLIPYISGLSFGLVSALAGFKAATVLIPYISGLSFGPMSRPAFRLDGKVLIPYISGLSFGQNEKQDNLYVRHGLNPLYLGAIFRAAASS